MAENYKHLYEQTKKMLTMYQDELIPGFRKKIEELEAKITTDNNAGSKWIPVTERLPTFDDLPDYAEYDYHLVCCKNFITGKRTVRPALASHDGFADKFLISCHGATHWMPLPEPPKEVK